MSAEDIRNVVVVGHKGTGKTSLIEAMMYLSKATPKLGKTGDRASGLDDSAEEKEHGASLEARLVTFKWNNKKLNVIDTPGEASFAADTRMAMAAADAAILVVSAKDGVQTSTERAYRWAEEAKLPCVVVVSKADDEHARVDDVEKELREKLGAPVAVMTLPVGTGTSFKGVAAVRTNRAWVGKPEGPTPTVTDIPAELKEAAAKGRSKLVDDVAGTDDALTEKYLTDGDLSQEELDQGARTAVAACKLTPVYVVASTVPAGVTALLNGIVDLVPPPNAHAPWPSVGEGEARKSVVDAPTAAVVFKTRIDPHVGRISYVRVLSGTLKPDTQVTNPNQNQRERIGQIQQGFGKDWKQVQEAIAGDLVALPKLKLTRTGETLADEKHSFHWKKPELPAPLFSRTLLLEGKGGEDKVAAALSRLSEEDPGLVYANDELSRALLVSGLGASHLEITVERLKRRAGIDAKLGPPKIAYRETITKKAVNIEGKQKKQSGGHGQFGVCYIDMEPLPRGSGFVFEDAIVGGVIPRQFIPSVEKGVVKGMARGTLAGYPVVDVKVRLHDGKYHAVDSSDAAFQVAGLRAFRAAMAEAKAAILEPLVKLEVTVPSDNMGDIIGDLNARGGKVMGTDSVRGNAVIVALVPLAQTLDYEPKLTSMTSGRGTFTMTPDRYDYCNPITQEKVIKESGFKPVDEED